MFALGRGYRGAADRIGRMINRVPRLGAEAKLEQKKVLLISDSPSSPTEAIWVTGSRTSILQALRRMASRTGGCVSIAEAVWQYHRAGGGDEAADSPSAERVEWPEWTDATDVEELCQGVKHIITQEPA